MKGSQILISSCFTVLDLCRVLCASSAALASYQSPSGQGLVEVLLQACAFESDWPSATNKTRDTNTMLVIRALANLTKTEAGRKSLAGDRLSEVSTALEISVYVEADLNDGCSISC
jgi:phospholipase A-2-activating protein